MQLVDDVRYYSRLVLSIELLNFPRLNTGVTDYFVKRYLSA